MDIVIIAKFSLINLSKDLSKDQLDGYESCKKICNLVKLQQILRIICTITYYNTYI